MGVSYRQSKRLGPLGFNFTGRGLSSASVRGGPVTYNTRGGLTVRLPFGLTWRSKRRRRVGTAMSLVFFVGLLAAVVVAVSGCASTSSRPLTLAPAAASAVPAADPAVVGASNHVTGTYPHLCHGRIPVAGGILPDPSCTPGSVRSDVTPATMRTTICRAGWTDTVRPPSSETDRVKTVAMAAYAEPAVTRSTTELDHFIPLELGGSNDVSNLWPEQGPGPGVHNDKDEVENRLHDAVCSGRTPLAAARQAIVTDWTTAEQRLGLG